MRFGQLALATGLLVSVFASLPGCSSELDESEGRGSTESEITSNANDRTAFLFFVSQGFTKIQAAGIVGNLDQESSMNPKSKQLGGGPGRGIAQWSLNARWKEENTFASGQGADPWALHTQLDFVMHEFNSNARLGLASLKAAKTLTSAVQIFQDKYEICGKCSNGNRMKFAQAALDAFGKEADNAAAADPATDPTPTEPNDPNVPTEPTDPTDPTTPDPNGDFPADPTDPQSMGDCIVDGDMGSCISTTDCKSFGGVSTAGLCPGNKTIQCCTMPF